MTAEKVQGAYLARSERGVFHPNERVANESIRIGFETYGLHSQCRRCEMSCRQYNAPGSEIAWCPRIARERGG